MRLPMHEDGKTLLKLARAPLKNPLGPSLAKTSRAKLSGLSLGSADDCILVVTKNKGYVLYMAHEDDMLKKRQKNAALVLADRRPYPSRF